METKSVMMLCNQRVAEELIAQDENFKHVVVICPWMNDDPIDAVLAVDRNLWNRLIESGEVYLREEVAGELREEVAGELREEVAGELREEVAGVKKNEDD